MKKSCFFPPVHLYKLLMFAAVIGLYALCEGALYGQPVVPSIAEDPAKRLQEEERTRERERRLIQETPDVDVKPVTEQEDDGRSPKDVPDVEPMFIITEIEIVGNTVLDARTIETIVAPFRNIPLGVNRINLLVRRLTVAYIEKGYITTRAYLREQNMKTGRLQIDIIEGRIETILYNGKSLALGERLVFPTEDGEILYLPDIEQGIDQLNRLRRNYAKATLVPGKGAGGTVIELSNEELKKIFFNIGFDNSGSLSTGRNRIRGGIETEDILGLQDYMVLNYTGSVDTNAALFSFNVPFGYNTFSYTFSYSDYQTYIGNFALYSGDTCWHNIAWNRVLQRNVQGKTTLDISFSQRKMRRYINDVALTPQRLSSIRVAVNRFKRLAWGQWMVEGAYSQGVGAFNSNSDISGLPRDSAHSHFKKYSALLSIGVPFYKDWLFRSSIHGQYASTGLYSSEQIYLGGDTTVRGFTESPIVGDKAVIWRNDSSFGFYPLPFDLPFRMEPYIFLDYGRTKQFIIGDWQQISGGGVGSRLFGKTLRAEATVGWPIKKPSSYRRGIQFMGNISYFF
jgi:hemolysin activation/secretion protein